MLSLCPFDISVGVGAFVIGLSKISSFFSFSIHLFNYIVFVLTFSVCISCTLLILIFVLKSQTCLICGMYVFLFYQMTIVRRLRLTGRLLGSSFSARYQEPTPRINYTNLTLINKPSCIRNAPLLCISRCFQTARAV